MDQGLQTQMPTGPHGWVKRTGSWIHSTISALVYSKHSFPYTNCGDNIEGYTQMSFKTPFPLSFSCLEPRTWLSSFLASRNRCRTESWPGEHRQRSWGGLPLVHLLSFCLRHEDLLFTHEHESHTKDGKRERWKGSVFLTALWSCWPSYLFKPMFSGFLLLAAECVPDQFTGCSFYHILFHNETLSCVLPPKHIMWS